MPIQYGNADYVRSIVPGITEEDVQLVLGWQKTLALLGFRGSWPHCNRFVEYIVEKYPSIWNAIK